MKPEFVDNRDGNTLASALRGHLQWLQETYKAPILLDLSIATGYFNPEGFFPVADELESLRRVRLLLGAEPAPARPMRRRLGEPRGERFRQEGLRKALAALNQGMQDDLNFLGFTEQSDAGLRRLVKFLRSRRIEVRRHEKGFLHGKAFIFAGEEGVIAGSSNFTGPGLTTNLELNLGQYQPHVVTRVRDWFEALWKESAPFDLASLYEARYGEYLPYLIYLRMLWELYGEELAQEKPPDASRIPLTTFQDDGLFRARRILEEFDGVVIADGVGLGKTFLAGRLLEEVAQERRQRAVLICPASLRDGTWKTFIHRHQLYVESYSYEQIAADPRLGGDGESCLKDSPDRYSLVVVDEAHAFRNPDTARARALRKLLRGSPPKKLVLVTATPVNNSLWDLYNLLTLFAGHDARFADAGIPSLKARFDDATARDPFDLQPDVLFDLLDRVVVRRTRRFVSRYYAGDQILLPDGSQASISFPRPKVRKLDYDLDVVLPGFFREISEALAPEKGKPKLTLARYAPSLYRKAGGTDASQEALVGLLRSAMLKRFESSVHAFAETVSAMVGAHEKFLEVLATGRVPTPELLAELTQDEGEGRAMEELVREHGAEPAADYNVSSLRRDIEADRDLLRAFATKARGVVREKDPKLKKLSGSLLEILSETSEGTDPPERVRDVRKVLIFSYYEDTVDWIFEYLRDLFEEDKRFAPYRGRLASVAGRESRDGVSREAAIFGFAPRSSEAPPGRSDDLYDVLVATDVLAEGLNLQQCRNIINYDLPWNPMRLVQRHGRIDRIGSPHAEVRIGCFFPTAKLDDLLKLEERLRSKIAQAAASVGLESPPLPGAASADVVFADTRKEIESLRDERPDLFERGGEDPHAHSGEEYRQALRKGLEQRGDEFLQLPWGAGSGFAGGATPGYVFCIRVLEKVFLRFVPADGGDLNRDKLACLRAADCEITTPRNVSAEALRGVYAAWERARKDVYDEWTRATDPQNLHPKVRSLFREVAAHLRSHPPEGISQKELEETLESVEAPWGQRIEREIRLVFTATDEKRPEEVSAAVVEKVRELGLAPYRPPQPLEPIDLDEVALVCWLAVSPG